jgi:hypothetical protein
MEPKQLIDKFEKGEIDDAAFDAEFAKMTPEQIKEADEHAETKLPSFVQKLKDVRRGIKKIESAAAPHQADDFGKKLREENFQKATAEFFAEIGIGTAEEQSEFLKEFPKFDSGSVTPENIKKDLKGFYASKNADELFRLRQESLQREKDAEDFTSMNVSSAGMHAGPASEAVKGATKEVQDFIRMAASKGRPMTVEQAERAIKVLKNGGKIS